MKSCVIGLNAESLPLPVHRPGSAIPGYRHMTEPCLEDPTKSVGEYWTCADPTCTCTCLTTGHVEADCPPMPGSLDAAVPVSMEEVFVKVAFGAVLALMLCFAFMCCFMFRKNKQSRTRAAMLAEVDDMELEDNQ